MLWTSEEQEKFFAKLEKDGLDKVKINIANNLYGQNKKMAETWVHLEECKNDRIYNNEILKLYNEANELAKQANDISQEAKRKSIVANFIAGISAVISLILCLVAIFK